MRVAEDFVSFLQSILSKLMPPDLCARCGHARARSAERCKVCGLARGAAMQTAETAEDKHKSGTREDARRAA